MDKFPDIPCGKCKKSIAPRYSENNKRVYYKHSPCDWFRWAEHVIDEYVIDQFCVADEDPLDSSSTNSWSFEESESES